MRILIIEDDNSIAELERDYLEINGFTVDIEADGMKGLHAALRGGYDLVILDVMLPGIDGFAVCAELRKESDVPIIMLSARKDDIDKVRGIGLGADDYVTKPFSPSELVARVKGHISRYERLTDKGGEKRDILKIRGLEIDTGAHRVFVNGEEKTLTAKEFELLLFLAEHPNRVFSREVLFDRVWGMDNFGDVSTVTVHIRRIREKLETKEGVDQYIDTVWGAGYRFRG